MELDWIDTVFDFISALGEGLADIIVDHIYVKENNQLHHKVSMLLTLPSQLPLLFEG